MDNSQNRRRVLVVRSGSAFDDGIYRLLCQEASLQVDGYTYQDETKLLARLAQGDQPDVIVLSTSKTAGRAHLAPGLLSQLAGQAVQIILISLEDSSMEAYSRRRLTARKSDDLVALIRRNPDGLT